MAISLLKPALYSANESTAAQPPMLLGGRCACGYLFFPMQRFGCERCGKNGGALTPASLRGSGKLITATVVHMHADKRRTVPFAVGTIALDDGPVIRALLSDISVAEHLQSAVVAELIVVTNEDGTQPRDLRFKRAPHSDRT